MPAFEYVVLKPLRVGDRMLERGEVTEEPNRWSARTLKVYTDGGYLQYGRVLEDVEYQEAPAFTGAPQGYDEREPQTPQESRGLAFDGSKGWRCWNCRKLCFLPVDLDEQAVWACHGCNQPQTIAQVKPQQQPTNISEEAYRRGLTEGDPTDNQLGVNEAMTAEHRLAADKHCQEPNCVRLLDHSGNHRNQQLREWPRKPDSRPVWATTYPGDSLDAREPIDPKHPIPGRR